MCVGLMARELRDAFCLTYLGSYVIRTVPTLLSAGISLEQSVYLLAGWLARSAFMTGSVPIQGYLE